MNLKIIKILLKNYFSNARKFLFFLYNVKLITFNIRD